MLFCTMRRILRYIKKGKGKTQEPAASHLEKGDVPYTADKRTVQVYRKKQEVCGGVSVRACG